MPESNVGQTIELEPNRVYLTVYHDSDADEAQFEVIDTLDFTDETQKALACIVRGMIAFALNNTEEVVRAGLDGLIKDGLVGLEPDDGIGEPEGNA